MHARAWRRPRVAGSGPTAKGPLFSGVPWVSLATFYIASVGINAAIRARGLTGRGQHINASLLHGVLATTIGAWQQVEHPDVPNFETWVIDPRAPKGFFQGIRRSLDAPLGTAPRSSSLTRRPTACSPTGWSGRSRPSLRVSTAAEDMVILHAYQDQLAEAVAQYPSAEWVRLAPEVGVPVQTVRSPEEALLDPLLVADGCVTEVDDPEVGPIRQVGRVVDLERHPAGRFTPRRRSPESTPRR